MIRWSILGLTAAAVILHELIEAAGFFRLPGFVENALIDLFLIIFGLAAYVGIGRMQQLSEEREELKKQVQESEKTVASAYQRLAAVFQTSQMFAEASEEKEVIDLVLRLSVDLVGAKGASFVPLDERGQTLPALIAGDLPYPEMDAWVEYLASPLVRKQCRSCESHEQLNLTCPLLQGSFLGTTGIYCLPLRRGDREYGVLNLYIPQPGGLDPEAQAILRTITDETTLAMEGIRLRRRELATLNQLQAVREKADLRSLLSSLLKTLQETMDADYALIAIWSGGYDQPKRTITLGELPDAAQALIEGISRSVVTTGQPVLLGEVAGRQPSSPGLRSLLAVPIIVQDQPALGTLLVANQRPKGFTQRHLSMLQTIAWQVAMVIRNFDLVSELEYKILIEERTRLAREIHDGLAQTLGFLKLKMTQMMNYLQNGEIDLLQKTMQTSYESLVGAYQDARQAIDGLRISAGENGLLEWMQQTVQEFQETSEFEIHLEDTDVDADLPPEVHAQLMRIVQEALSNVRKHARAEQVWISCKETGEDLVLEIRDDGIGFCPEDFTGSSQHGLRGMRERAELIGADFQIISGQAIGTTVRVRLPLEIGEGIR